MKHVLRERGFAGSITTAVAALTPDKLAKVYDEFGDCIEIPRVSREAHIEQL